MAAVSAAEKSLVNGRIPVERFGDSSSTDDSDSDSMNDESDGELVLGKRQKGLHPGIEELPD